MHFRLQTVNISTKATANVGCKRTCQNQEQLEANPDATPMDLSDQDTSAQDSHCFVN